MYDLKRIYLNLVVYCSTAEGGGTIRKNSHFVSSAIHIKIGRRIFLSVRSASTLLNIDKGVDFYGKDTYS